MNSSESDHSKVEDDHGDLSSDFANKKPGEWFCHGLNFFRCGLREESMRELVIKN